MIPPVSCGMINSNKFRIEINSVKIPFYKLKGHEEGAKTAKRTLCLNHRTITLRTLRKFWRSFAVSQNHNINQFIQFFTHSRSLRFHNMNCTIESFTSVQTSLIVLNLAVLSLTVLNNNPHRTVIRPTNFIQDKSIFHTVFKRFAH